MNHYVGIDVSLEASSVCVVDGNGKIVREGKIASEPDTLIPWLKELKLELTRIGSSWASLDRRDDKSGFVKPIENIVIRYRVSYSERNVEAERLCCLRINHQFEI
jgi:hypothetical protein